MHVCELNPGFLCYVMPKSEQKMPLPRGIKTASNIETTPLTE